MAILSDFFGNNLKFSLDNHSFLLYNINNTAGAVFENYI
jgi:hypothetical protein